MRDWAEALAMFLIALLVVPLGAVLLWAFMWIFLWLCSISGLVMV